MSVSLDIKYAARLLAKKPAFTALTVLIVAIGLGLTLYTYSLLNSLVFTPLTLNNDKPIYAVEAQYDYTHLSRRPADPFDLYKLKNELNLLEDLGVYQEGTTFVGGAGANTAIRKFNSTYVSWNIFEFAGVQPILGRGFSPEDHFEGAEPSVVLSYEVFQNYFRGDESVVGTMVPLDAEPNRIIGVMPEGFAFPAIAEIWQPLPQVSVAATERSYNGVFGFARLADGVTLSQLRTEMDAYSTELSTRLDEDMNWRINTDGKYLSAEPFKKAAITQYYSMFMAMFVVVFLILLLACINVGNLLLARVNQRFKEIAIRVAMGVPRKRLILQMLWESIFICSIGGLLALLLAAWGLEISNQVFDQTYAVDNLKPFWWHVQIEANGIFLLISAVVAMIFITGYIPAWRALSGDFNAVLRDGTRGAIGKKAAQASKVLVISEIFLSCVVLMMASILLSTSYSAGIADYGVETENRLTAQLQLPPVSFGIRRDTEFEHADRLKRSAFYYALKDELESQPNIQAVAMMTELPGRGEGTSYYEIEGREAPVYNENPYSNNEGVAKDSWRALGMRIIQGRDFDHRDIGEGVLSIIINESIAKEFFPDGDAIGQRVRRANPGNKGEWNTIMGVVSDTFHGSTMRSSSTSYNSYHIMDNWGLFRVNMAMHYTGLQVEAEKTLLQAVDKVNTDVGVYHIQSYDNLIKQPMMLVVAVSKVFLLCGIIAAFLAASGIYAVASNSISQRTQEIGVRRALGSSDAGIMRLFMLQASQQLAIGLTIGIGLSIWLVNFMSETMIINDLSYVLGMLGVPLLIIFMVLLATFIPTKKVVLMEPSEALHHD
ncbi:FtsX-like permease family protein [Paraglaciecola arctica]|uniref:ABC transporter permease n=1 Tax=Paraglaciecola arctica BSs20135 TaxID=493475 RepID=K6YSS3_9ALTE|nr:FtsX-like permease family protein [Paraglaciecola arctica]GAC19743.1 ABC transporter permease [Paraglaciecola arctica BSs20135]